MIQNKYTTKQKQNETIFYRKPNDQNVTYKYRSTLMFISALQSKTIFFLLHYTSMESILN